MFLRYVFFFAFFWAYFHRSLAPTFDLGSCWPPVGVEFLNPFSVPLLNTAVLLSSGVRVTWAHHSLLEKDRAGGIQGLFVTFLLGCYFTFLQIYILHPPPPCREGTQKVVAC